MEEKSQFEKPYYVSIHAVNSFRERIANLPTIVIRQIILTILNTSQPYAYSMFNHQRQPVYQGEYSGKKFYIPVVKERKKVDAWDAVPTILVEGMKFNFRKENPKSKEKSPIVVEEEIM